jgi:cytochrome c oxidase subunit IV
MSSHVVPLKVYFVVFGALMALTLLTVVVAFVDLGPLNTVIALTIAVVKGLLVILFFMHVLYGSPLTRVFAFAGFFWLLILLVFTFSDFLSRGWMPIPPGWN